MEGAGFDTPEKIAMLGEFLLDAGEEEIVCASPGDMVGQGRDVLQDKFRLLHGKVKSRISMVVLSEIVPIPHVNLERWAKICSLSAWMRWCREAEVLFGPSGTAGLLGTERSCRWAISLSKQSKIWSKAADTEK